MNIERTLGNIQDVMYTEVNTSDTDSTLTAITVGTWSAFISINTGTGSTFTEVIMDNNGCFVSTCDITFECILVECISRYVNPN
jgi:roadblock/LC7 domain-containing protein